MKRLKVEITVISSEMSEDEVSEYLDAREQVNEIIRNTLLSEFFEEQAVTVTSSLLKETE